MTVSDLENLGRVSWIIWKKITWIIWRKKGHIFADASWRLFFYHILSHRESTFKHPPLAADIVLTPYFRRSFAPAIVFPPGFRHRFAPAIVFIQDFCRRLAAAIVFTQGFSSPLRARCCLTQYIRSRFTPAIVRRYFTTVIVLCHIFNVTKQQSSYLFYGHKLLI